ncbi:glutathione S-transferase, putative [Oceanicaulis sp. HTCC2633]|uniref:glutathione S-transferase family protein n=1 Tax=Oceanicaulis sp. HTCC2633 TaxID=314254 RepID=UPI0000669A4A|nr:glutathione S-transferase family protein [Oceanicaulis sp. HTCC2633]EAP89205.1 glutathione S-transferase, putative [Oceanicaulis sp. HTCC2633]
MKFYDCATAPSPRRARMVIAEKRIDVETIEIDLRSGQQFSEDFRTVNPGCTVPALLTDDGESLCENASIVRYLEALYPDPPLLGTSPIEQARVAEWVWRAEFDGLISVMEVLRNTSKAMKDRALPGPDPVPQIPELAERGMMRGQRFFKTLDTRLSDTPWLAGDAFSFADITAFVFVEFAAWVKMIPGDELEALAKWRDACKARPSGQV